MKKSIFVLAIVLVVAMFAAMPVMAAPTEQEQTIIDALNAAGVPADYVNQAAAWLETTDASSSASAIVSQINAAASTAAGRSAADIPQADRNAILANITAAASTVGLNVGVDGRTVTVTDGQGNIVVSATAPARNTGGSTSTTTPTYTAPDTTNPIRTTGLAVDFSALAYTGIALSGLFGIAVVLGSKRKPASAAAA